MGKAEGSVYASSAKEGTAIWDDRRGRRGEFKIIRGGKKGHAFERGTATKRATR